MSDAYEGASANRLSGGFWSWYERDAAQDWISESAPLAERAAHLVRNDPVICAAKTAMIAGTHGANGLRHRSLATEGLRDLVEEIISEASSGTNVDACGMMNRREFDEALDTDAMVRGEAFAVRAWLPDRPGAITGTCWRFIGRDRVCNRPGDKDGPRLFQGISLTKDGAPDGIWVAPPERSQRSDKKAWTFVPWYDDAGVPVVIHRVGHRPAGTYRGVSEFAPLLPIARQVKGLVEAYVVAKRIQACHPIYVLSDDPEAAARADRNGAVLGPNTVVEPGKTYYLSRESDIRFPSTSFNGADMREFLDTLYRNQFAALGLPVDVVLAQLTNSNMASSRSAWLQFYRVAERRQNAHISQVSSVMDLAAVAEAVATGRLTLPAGLTLRGAIKGQYVRPAKSMPDPAKEAAAVEKWLALGRDHTSLWAESAGMDFRDSVTQRTEDEAWLDETARGPAALSRDRAFIARVVAADEGTTAANVDGLTWPIVVAAGGFETAPGATVAAVAGAAEQAAPTADPAASGVSGLTDEAAETQEKT